MNTTPDGSPPPTPSRAGEVRNPERLRLTLPDGKETAVYRHRPPGEPASPPVLYLHGIQSHPGWFFGSAARLAARGHPVFQVTRRGSGQATSSRGDAPSARQLLADVDAAVALIRERTGARRVAGVGVSWGGKLLAVWAIHHPELLTSATLVAPGIAALVDVSTATKLRVAAALLLRPTVRFDIPLNEPSLFTGNESMREFIVGDPLRLRKATARFLYASRCLDRRLSRARGGALRAPATLILASRDRIIDNEATRQAVNRLTDGEAEVVEIEGDHTLEFEPDPEPYHDALARGVSRS